MPSVLTVLFPQGVHLCRRVQRQVLGEGLKRSGVCHLLWHQGSQEGPGGGASLGAWSGRECGVTSKAAPLLSTEDQWPCPRCSGKWHDWLEPLSPARAL